MFGRNPSRPVENAADGSVLSVQEIFPTLQGEGPNAGTPAVFIRLWGCHLKCHFCDTDFESNNQRMTVSEIGVEVLKYRGTMLDPLVVITGGEPMRQNIAPLIQFLINAAFEVQIETSGTLWVRGLDELGVNVPVRPSDDLSIVVSPKTQFVHEKIIEYAAAWKYIISASYVDEHDGLPTVSTQIQGARARIKRPPDNIPCQNIFLQPQDDGHPAVNAENLKAAIASCMKHGYRLSLQQHKILGLP